MKKILGLIIAVGMLFAFAGQAAAFDSNDLVMVIYNAEDKEVAVNLGDLSTIDFSSTLVVNDADYLSMFGSNVSDWDDLSLAFFGGSQDYSNYGAFFATTKSSLDSYGDIGTLLNSAYNLYTAYGDGDVFVVDASTATGATTYNMKLNSNGTAPGFYAGTNSADKDYGEADLSALLTDGSVEMYLYYIIPDWTTMTMTLDKGADASTDYFGVISFQTQAVPVPGSLLLLGSGLLGLLGIRRKNA